MILSTSIEITDATRAEAARQHNGGEAVSIRQDGQCVTIYVRAGHGEHVAQALNAAACGDARAAQRRAWADSARGVAE